MGFQCLNLRQVITAMGIVALITANAIANPFCEDFYASDPNVERYYQQQQHPDFTRGADAYNRRMQQQRQMGSDYDLFWGTFDPVRKTQANEDAQRPRQRLALLKLDIIKDEAQRTATVDSLASSLKEGQQIRLSFESKDVEAHLQALLTERIRPWAEAGIHFTIEAVEGTTEKVLTLKRPTQAQILNFPHQPKRSSNEKPNPTLEPREVEPPPQQQQQQLPGYRVIFSR